MRRKKEPEEPPKAHYAVNISKLNTLEQDQYMQSLSERLDKATESGMSVKSIINPLQATGTIYGPFENQRGAELMAASELDENNRDYFGIRWGFICTKMTEVDFQRPLLERARVFVCSDKDCKAVQRFKGACAKCKANNKPLIKTIEVRDWEGRLQ